MRDRRTVDELTIAELEEMLGSKDGGTEIVINPDGSLTTIDWKARTEELRNFIIQDKYCGYPKKCGENCEGDKCPTGIRELLDSTAPGEKR